MLTYVSAHVLKVVLQCVLCKSILDLCSNTGDGHLLGQNTHKSAHIYNLKGEKVKEAAVRGWSL